MQINKRDFISDYVVEAQENLDGICNSAMTLANNSSDYETLKELLRLLHTLKGSSRMMEFSQIEKIINSLETVFKIFQENRIDVPANCCYLLMNVCEIIRKTIEKIQIYIEENEEKSGNAENDEISENSDSEAALDRRIEIKNFDFIIKNIQNAAESKSFSYNFEDEQKKDGISVSNEGKKIVSNELEGETSDFQAACLSSVNSDSDFAVTQESIPLEKSTLSEKIASLEKSDLSEKINSSENALFNDTKTIKIQISQINAILQNYDKLLMRQIKLKKELSILKSQFAKNGLDGGTESFGGKNAGVLKGSDLQIFRDITENIEVLENQSVEIQKQIISLRMLPFDMILQPIKRSIFQDALKAGKNIDFDIPNSEITIDKTILENLPPIIMHLARNALDHGIESTVEREKLGKPQKGKVSITVEQVSSRIFVTVKDDGRGIDFEKIREKALKNFPERAKEIQNADEDSLLQFIFMSGFSTKNSVTELSGRGIGLDVVRTEMEKLKGKIRVESKKNQGCTFELSLPNSLATQDGLFIKEDDKSYLVLSHYVKEILTVNKNDFLQLQTGSVINLHNQLIPVYDFDSITQKYSDGIEKKSKNKPNDIPVIVIEYLNKKIAIMADKILHYNTVVIKPLPPILKDFQALQGVVFDENYEIIPVLNIPDAMRRFERINVYDQKKLEMKKTQKIRSILVVDDSHTTRHIEQIILEAEGYKVSTACDGIEALEKMKLYNFDLVVTDVKMPRMDGFVLIHNIRHTEGLKNIPVIVISSVFESDTLEKVKAIGAQGYIVKSDFERENLVAKVKELLG